VIETAGTSVRVATREWLMPKMGRRRSGVTVRELMVCPECNASRDALYWVDGKWCCRGQGCGNLSHASRHQQRWCPAIRRRAKLLRKLARVVATRLACETASGADCTRTSGDARKLKAGEPRPHEAEPTPARSWFAPSNTGKQRSIACSTCSTETLNSRAKLRSFLPLSQAAKMASSCSLGISSSTMPCRRKLDHRDPHHGSAPPRARRAARFPW